MKLRIRFDARRRPRDQRSHCLFLERILADGEEAADGGKARIGVPADEGLPQLERIRARQVVGIGRIVDRGIEVDH